MKFIAHVQFPKSMIPNLHPLTVVPAQNKTIFEVEKYPGTENTGLSQILETIQACTLPCISIHPFSKHTNKMDLIAVMYHDSKQNNLIL